MKKKKLSKIRQSAKRKAFFEENGNLASWRGRSVAFEDKKKKKNKEECREKIDEKERE